MTAETYIMVEGNPMPAALQPPQSELQPAFRRSAKGDRIVIDMDAARVVARDMIRQARGPAFERNDAATIRAMQANDQAALAAARTKGDALRAAPQDPRIDAAQTPDDLLDAVEAINAELAA